MPDNYQLTEINVFKTLDEFNDQKATLPESAISLVPFEDTVKLQCIPRNGDKGTNVSGYYRANPIGASVTLLPDGNTYSYSQDMNTLILRAAEKNVFCEKYFTVYYPYVGSVDGVTWRTTEDSTKYTTYTQKAKNDSHFIVLKFTWVAGIVLAESIYTNV